ncbi:MAG: TerB family tellurite resistance protein [Imperialibacter sp.]|jgi:uncharacterized membrane protein YebE (DUF533 family)|uniref:TerB family tellurite resistance protein n=1 Tax=Imperialibacter sp. TaxID=2038411 RepID=UPI0032ECF55A
MSIKTHISALIQLASADDDLADKERELIFLIGESGGLSHKQIEELLENPLDLNIPDSLSDDDRFELLYNVVQLMKIDNEVFLSEIKFCEDVAEKLGFARKVISELSANIYSDPAITSDRALLRQKAMKYKK